MKTKLKKTTFEKIQRAVALFVLAAFSFTTFSAPYAQAGLWEERRKAAEKMSEKSSDARAYPQLASAAMVPGQLQNDVTRLTNSLSKEQNDALQARIQSALNKHTARHSKGAQNTQIPAWLWEKVASYGNIERVQLAKGAKLSLANGKISSNLPVVIHIQDVHDVLGVQKNLAFLLKELTDSGVDLVGLEGTEGRLDAMEEWHKFPDRESVMEAAGYLLSVQLLTGSEIAGLARTRDEVEFWGLEDKENYMTQVNAYKNAFAQNKPSAEWAAQTETLLASLKEKTYSEPAKKFDRAQTQYEKGELKLGEWISALAKFSGQTSKFPNVSAFLKLYETENSLDMAKISAEQRKVLKELSESLSKDDLMALLQDCLIFRLGRIGYADFYESLKDRCRSAKIPVSSELSKYIQYVAGTESINQESLQNEISTLSRDTGNVIVRASEASRELHEIDQDFRLLKKGIAFSLTPSDFAEFTAHESRILGIAQRIGAPELNPALIKNISLFNKQSDVRSHAFVGRLTKKMSEKNAKVSVLVAGGAHTGGLETLLKDKDISFITIRPKMNLAEITKDYHPMNAFSRDLIPLEKLFAPEKVTIVKALNLGQPWFAQSAVTVKSFFQAITAALKSSRQVTTVNTQTGAVKVEIMEAGTDSTLTKASASGELQNPIAPKPSRQFAIAPAKSNLFFTLKSNGLAFALTSENAIRHATNYLLGTEITRKLLFYGGTMAIAAEIFGNHEPLPQSDGKKWAIYLSKKFPHLGAAVIYLYAGLKFAPRLEQKHIENNFLNFLANEHKDYSKNFVLATIQKSVRLLGVGAIIISMYTLPYVIGGMVGYKVFEMTSGMWFVSIPVSIVVGVFIVNNYKSKIGELTHLIYNIIFIPVSLLFGMKFPLALTAGNQIKRTSISKTSKDGKSSERAVIGKRMNAKPRRLSAKEKFIDEVVKNFLKDDVVHIAIDGYSFTGERKTIFLERDHILLNMYDHALRYRPAARKYVTDELNNLGSNLVPKFYTARVMFAEKSNKPPLLFRTAIHPTESNNLPAIQKSLAHPYRLIRVLILAAIGSALLPDSSDAAVLLQAASADAGSWFTAANALYAVLGAGTAAIGITWQKEGWFRRRTPYAMEVFTDYITPHNVYKNEEVDLQKRFLESLSADNETLNNDIVSDAAIRWAALRRDLKIPDESGPKEVLRDILKDRGDTQYFESMLDEEILAVVLILARMRMSSGIMSTYHKRGPAEAYLVGSADIEKTLEDFNIYKVKNSRRERLQILKTLAVAQRSVTRKIYASRETNPRYEYWQDQINKIDRKLAEMPAQPATRRTRSIIATGAALLAVALGYAFHGPASLTLGLPVIFAMFSMPNGTILSNIGMNLVVSQVRNLMDQNGTVELQMVRDGKIVFTKKPSFRESPEMDIRDALAVTNFAQTFNLKIINGKTVQISIHNPNARARLSVFDREARIKKFMDAGLSEDQAAAKTESLEKHRDPAVESWTLALAFAVLSHFLQDGFMTQAAIGFVLSAAWYAAHPGNQKDNFRIFLESPIMMVLLTLGAVPFANYFQSFASPGALSFFLSFLGYGLPHWLGHWAWNANVEPFKRLSVLVRKPRSQEYLDSRAISRKLWQVLPVPRKAKKNEPLRKQLEKPYLDGGMDGKGTGVGFGAAVDGSFALHGNQGYYTDEGDKVFIGTVENMKAFFDRRNRVLSAKSPGKSIRVIIKTGIGGQHTPFQAASDGFSVSVQVQEQDNTVILGEYELGKDYEAALQKIVTELGIDWDQIVVIPSSKSGSTDETMMIFVEILYVLLKHNTPVGVSGATFADSVLDVLHEINFYQDGDKKGQEKPIEELFKVPAGKNLIDMIASKSGADRAAVLKSFQTVLGNMFFETTPRVDQSRLAAFIKNSGLDKELGPDHTPGFGEMYDNVGGRWTADLHMMTFLAKYGLSAKDYWRTRYNAIRRFRFGWHPSVKIGNRIVDEKITDIALVVPDHLFWFGKSIEQNYNESIFQDGSSNLVTLRQSLWENQKHLYSNEPNKLVINLSALDISEDEFAQYKNDLRLPRIDFQNMSGQQIADSFARLNSLFYGITHTVGTRLIAATMKRARDAAYAAGNAELAEQLQVKNVDMKDLDNPATRIVIDNLYLRQPYVELGKKILEKRLKALQERAKQNPAAIDQAYADVYAHSKNGQFLTNIAEIPAGNAINMEELQAKISAAMDVADKEGRKFVPFIYLEGVGFITLREYFMSKGIPWVMQGTGDQHISFNQVAFQPQKYLPFIISMNPETPQAGRKAVLAKGYLDRVSTNLVRDYFAESMYQVLLDRSAQGGKAAFLRTESTLSSISLLEKAFERAANENFAKNQKLRQGADVSQYLNAPQDQLKISDDFYRTYDFRGEKNVDDDSVEQVITPAMAFRLAVTWAKMAHEKADKLNLPAEKRTVVLARDARKVNKELIDAVRAGFQYAGIHVLDIQEEGPNCVTSYSAAIQLYKPLMGVFLTSSHVARPDITSSHVARPEISEPFTSIHIDVKAFKKEVILGRPIDLKILQKIGGPENLEGDDKKVAEKIASVLNNLDETTPQQLHAFYPKGTLNIQVRGVKVVIQDESGEPQSLTSKEIKQTTEKTVDDFVKNPKSLRAQERKIKGTVKAINPDDAAVRLNALIGRVADTGHGGKNLYDLARALEASENPLQLLEEWEEIFGNDKPLKGFKCVIDGAHTPSGKIAADTLEQLGAKVIRKNEKVLALHGMHKADPSKPENLAELKETMLAETADFGLSFDLDGDRGAIVVRLPNGDFLVLPPDNLMAALMPFFKERGGYNPEVLKRNGKKGVAFIKDVLGTWGVVDKAKEQGFETFQTDAGYVFLKARRRKLMNDGYVIPMYAEKSGHAWTDVTGPIENPVAVGVLYAMMVKNYKDAHPASTNPFYEAFEKNTTPYRQSARFQPAIDKNFLRKQSATALPEDPEEPRQLLIARARHNAIEHARTDFAVGKPFQTAAGVLEVSYLDINVDEDEEKGLNRYADIHFTLNGVFAARIVFRASANDPTYVSAFETPLLPGENKDAMYGDAVNTRLMATMKVMKDWLENEKAKYGSVDENQLGKSDASLWQRFEASGFVGFGAPGAIMSAFIAVTLSAAALFAGPVIPAATAAHSGVQSAVMAWANLILSAGTPLLIISMITIISNHMGRPHIPNSNITPEQLQEIGITGGIISFNEEHAQSLALSRIGNNDIETVGLLQHALESDMAKVILEIRGVNDLRHVFVERSITKALRKTPEKLIVVLKDKREMSEVRYLINNRLPSQGDRVIVLLEGNASINSDRGTADGFMFSIRNDEDMKEFVVQTDLAKHMSNNKMIVARWEVPSEEIETESQVHPIETFVRSLQHRAGNIQILIAAPPHLLDRANQALNRPTDTLDAIKVSVVASMYGIKLWLPEHEKDRYDGFFETLTDINSRDLTEWITAAIDRLSAISRISTTPHQTSIRELLIPLQRAIARISQISGIHSVILIALLVPGLLALSVVSSDAAVSAVSAGTSAGWLSVLGAWSPVIGVGILGYQAFAYLRKTQPQTSDRITELAGQLGDADERTAFLAGALAHSNPNDPRTLQTLRDLLGGDNVVVREPVKLLESMNPARVDTSGADAAAHASQAKLSELFSNRLKAAQEGYGAAAFAASSPEQRIGNPVHANKIPTVRNVFVMDRKADKGAITTALKRMAQLKEQDAEFTIVVPSVADQKWLASILAQQNIKTEIIVQKQTGNVVPTQVSVEFIAQNVPGKFAIFTTDPGLLIESLKHQVLVFLLGENGVLREIYTLDKFMEAAKAQAVIAVQQ